MRIKKGFNPFYVLLVVVGTAFCLTACAYGVMAMRAMRPHHGRPPTAPSGPHQLMEYMERNGEKLLLEELAVLTLATFAAIGTDGYWTRRAAVKSGSANMPPVAAGSESHKETKS